ncbi:TonB-dependent receptor [Hymenobacter sp. BT186]|uniref:TonB-dependent receptor n=1 Tax=Hymenobacter telluris TaxID=2816474 RepID=A0A939J760_9BACT|nr:TonB-dependent receptor [Hymenobacter telluris]MBO0356394.1 TonB-dependent receptor [Hymenobacter telluris]MBW3372418.1 TonB-dependent receptor [Hymenobacter norwichensis]
MKHSLLLPAILLCAAAPAWAQQTRQLSGQVLDAKTGEGLAGVTVLVKGTTNGASTGADGQFTLSVPTTGEVQLTVSYIGYVTQTVTAKGDGNLNIRLASDTKALDEVVVIGYGQVKKSDVTGAIVSVKEEDIKKTPAANVMESLQGRLPGVDITRSSGSATSGVSVTVRGNRSLTANNGPLFIVDGVQYNSIQDINPNDIASMEVLKDAASTAVYGSRGANGVIIVTTKRGTSGQPRVTINSYYGQTDVANYPKVNNAEQYVAQKREANRTTGLWNSTADDSKIFTPYELESIANGVSTDWMELLLRKGTQQEHQIGLSGGSEKTKFYTSFDYFNEQGLFKLDNLNRYSIRFNIDQEINKKITIGLQSQLTYYNQSVRRDPTNQANKINPLLTPYDANGNIAIFPNSGNFINPIIDEVNGNYENNTRTTRTFTTGYVSYQILPSLNIRSNLGLTLSNARTGIYQGSNTLDRNGSVPQSSYGTQFLTNWSWENIVNYNKTFGDHSLTATGVTSLLTFNTENSNAQGRNQLLASQLYYNLANANQQLGINSGYEDSKLISFTGRVQYGYKGRYLLTLTGRSDGSSKLAAGNKWAFFPSAAVAWRIIDEDFMKNVSAVTDLKLRVSYGRAGNYDVPVYSSQSLLSRIPFGYGETSAPGYTFANRIGNPDLGWELSNTKNIGLDFGLLDNRLTGSVDVYNTKTTDLLLDRFLPLSSGVSVITQNIGSTRNRGIEVGLNGRLIDNENFKWNAGVAWFMNREEIVDLGGASSDITNGWFIGSPTRVIYDYEKIGIWQLDEVDQAKAYGQKPGQIKVRDLNGDGQITASADRKVLGWRVPKWNGSFNSDFSYKGFDLSFQFFARMGQMFNYEYNSFYDPQGIENSSRQNYWTPENPSNDYPRPDASLSKTTQQSALYGNTLYYRDGSYVKLRAATLGYNIPKSVLDKLHMSSLRVYVQGKNLATWSDIEDYDPERGGAITSPIPRVVLAGLNLGF